MEYVSQCAGERTRRPATTTGGQEARDTETDGSSGPTLSLQANTDEGSGGSRKGKRECHPTDRALR